MLLELLPLADYPAGDIVTVDVALPDDAVDVVTHVARNADDAPDVWASPCTVSLHPEVFAEEHASEGWVSFGYAASEMGRYTHRTGRVLESLFSRPVDCLPAARGRRIRARINFSAPIRTRVWVEVT